MADVATVTALSGLLFGAVPFVPLALCVPARRLLCAWAVFGALAACLWHGVGRQWPRGGWYESSASTSSFEPWTSAWRTPAHTTLRVPADEAELRELILTACRPLRVVGSGHSWSSTGHTHGTLIDIRRLNAVRALTSKRVTVQAGMKVQDAVQFLFARGLCLHGTGSIRNQAIGGVIAHGVHGAHWDGFNRHVVGLRVLLANGTFWNVGQEDDLFMWRASVGMLGAIVEATLEVFPLATLRFARAPIPSVDSLRALPAFGVATFTGYLYPCPYASHLGHARIGWFTNATRSDELLDNQTDFASRLLLHFNEHMHPAMQYVWLPLGTLVSCAAAWWGLLLEGPDTGLLPNDGLIPRPSLPARVNKGSAVD
jgi:FAD/FMN-containing dehydrogenase